MMINHPVTAALPATLLAAAIATGQVPPQAADPAPGQVVNDAARPDPVVKRKQPAPSRSAASRLPQWADGNWDRFSSRVMSLALCVAHHESWNEHNGRRLYTALNLQGSSASGFAQWIDSTWRIQARRAGVGTQYARAYLAPARIQAEVFAFQVKNFGMYPWHGTGCEGT